MRRWESTIVALLVASAVATPLLVPRLPGNSVPVDLVNIATIVFGGVLLVRARAELRVPLGVGYFLVVLGGTVATATSIAPERSVLALVQDAYLFGWFVIVVNLLLRLGAERTGRIVAVAWAATGLVMSSYLWLATTRGVDTLFGYRTVNAYGRAYGTFRDPNMAGVYSAMSLFVLWASPFPRNRWIKLSLSVPFVLGVHATGSNTALFAVALGGLGALIVAFVSTRRCPLAAGLTVVGVVLAGIVMLPPDAALTADESVQALGGTDIFAASLGRVDDSLGPRIERWQESLELFGDRILVGIGPSVTNETLELHNASLGGEIHSDYVAGFLERGVVGGIGVLLLFGVATLLGVRLAFNQTLRTKGWSPAALSGALVTVLLAGVTLEGLHFRHVWLLFALVAALAYGVPTEEAAGPTDTQAP